MSTNFEEFLRIPHFFFLVRRDELRLFPYSADLPRSEPYVRHGREGVARRIKPTRRPDFSPTAIENDRIFLMNESEIKRRVLTLFLIGTAVYGLILFLCLLIGKNPLTVAVGAAGAIVYAAFALYLLWLRRSGFNLSESVRPARKRPEPARAEPFAEAVRQDKPLKIYVAAPGTPMPDESGPDTDDAPKSDPTRRFTALRRDESGPDETVLFKTRAHWMRFFRRGFWPLLILIGCLFVGVVGNAQSWPIINSSTLALLGAAIIACAAVALNLWIDCANDEFRIQSDRVAEVYRKPFGFEREKVALLNKIQTVEIARKNLFAFLFNYGDVAVNIGESVLRFEYVPDPKTFRERIFTQIAALENREQDRAAGARRQFIEEIVTAIRREK